MNAKTNIYTDNQKFDFFELILLYQAAICIFIKAGMLTISLIDVTLGMRKSYRFSDKIYFDRIITFK